LRSPFLSIFGNVHDRPPADATECIEVCNGYLSALLKVYSVSRKRSG
jgi:hypothetical protein